MSRVPTQPPGRGNTANVKSTLVLIGYFPKRRTPAPEELRAVGAVEICSVSECLAPGPEGWVEAWLHNAHGCFNSPDDAQRVIGEATAEFQILAYRLLPVRFLKGHAEPIEVSPSRLTPPPAVVRSLGFDVRQPVLERLVRVLATVVQPDGSGGRRQPPLPRGQP